MNVKLYACEGHHHSMLGKIRNNFRCAFVISNKLNSILKILLFIINTGMIAMIKQRSSCICTHSLRLFMYCFYCYIICCKKKQDRSKSCEWSLKVQKQNHLEKIRFSYFSLFFFFNHNGYCYFVGEEDEQQAATWARFDV